MAGSEGSRKGGGGRGGIRPCLWASFSLECQIFFRSTKYFQSLECQIFSAYLAVICFFHFVRLFWNHVLI